MPSFQRLSGRYCSSVDTSHIASASAMQRRQPLLLGDNEHFKADSVPALVLNRSRHVELLTTQNAVTLPLSGPAGIQLPPHPNISMVPQVHNQISYVADQLIYDNTKWTINQILEPEYQGSIRRARSLGRHRFPYDSELQLQSPPKTTLRISLDSTAIVDVKTPPASRNRCTIKRGSSRVVGRDSSTGVSIRM